MIRDWHVKKTLSTFTEQERKRLVVQITRSLSLLWAEAFGHLEIISFKPHSASRSLSSKFA